MRIRSRYGQVHVSGYTRKDGTYVPAHYRSAPDGNFSNNWSTYGNVNPYTGRIGTKVSPPSNYGSDVYVIGYTRSDGTYVNPHYRSAPDGNFSNNWSTQGNSIPYTGSIGKRVTLPADYGVRSSSAFKAKRVRPSVEVSITTTRERIANQIRRQGYNLNWQEYSLADLYEMSDRISVANSLKSKGYDINWEDYSYSELFKMDTDIQ